MQFSFLKFLTAVMLGLYSGLAIGQGTGVTITGSVSSPEGETIEGASVYLLDSEDETLIKAEFTSKTGNFFFQNIPFGAYKIVVEHPDYAVYRSPGFSVTEEHDFGMISLENRSGELKEVEVVVRKPLIEQRFDKTILNVDKSISNAGTTALEVLQKAPGMVVDQNDNISMRGRSGVILLLNGKRVPMSGPELANMLRGLPADAIDRIEIITNPSAKYEAEGSAGMIDIILKKDTRQGTNGSITSSLGYGEYFKTNQGFQLNHRVGKFNLFGSYNFGYRKEFTDLDIERKFLDQGNITGGYDQQNRFKYTIKSHTGRLGADYDLTSNTLVGVSVYGFKTDFERNNQNRALVLDADLAPASYFLTSGHSENERPSGGINLNFRHTIDTTGRELSGDLDYVHYRNSDLQDYTTRYFDLEMEPTEDPYLLHGDLEGALTIRSAKLDYSQPFKWIQGTLEAGAKSSIVDSDNDLRFFDRSNGGNVLDENISNHFLYSENINAGYLNINSKREKFSFQFGLRVENTNAHGNQLTTGEEFDKNYTQLFPSGYIGYTFSENNELGLSISRRINRPTYNQLNPFKTFLDPSTYSAGNPYLDPELSYAFELTHTWRQKFVMKYSYSRTEDVILNVLSLDPEEENVVVQTNLNLAQLDYYSFTLTAPFAIGEWFNSTNNATAYYGRYQGNLANTNLDNGRPAFSLNSTNTFRVSETWTAEFSGMFRSSEIYGFLDVDPFWMVSAGIQKQFWEKKGSLKLNVSDLFYSMQIDAVTELTGYTETFHQTRDSRVATLSFTYRFGSQNPSRRKTGGAEEEKSRVQ